MDYDKEKVDEMTLALLYLVMDSDHDTHRAWKGFDWATLDRLHEKRFIGDPKSQARPVIMTDEGARRSEELFRKHFARK
jgi:hypothetical protein